MGSFLKNNLELTALVDINERGVTGALVQPNPKGRNLLRYVTKTRTGGEASAVKSVEGLTMAAGEVITELTTEKNSKKQETKKAKNPPKNFIFIISSPFQYSYITDITREWQRLVKVDDSVINDLLNEKEPNYDDACKIIRSDKKNDLGFIKKEIHSINLNGYPAKEVKNKQARSISIRLLCSLAPQGVIKALDSRVKTEMRSAETKFAPKTDIILEFLNSFPNNGIYSYVDVGLSGTLVVTVADKLPTKFSYITYGSHDLTNAIATEFQVSMAVASSYTALYFSGQGEKKFMKRIEEIIDPLLTKWEREYENNMYNQVIPQNVYFTSDHFLKEKIGSILEKKHPDAEVRSLDRVYTEATGHEVRDEVLNFAISTYLLKKTKKG